MSKVNITLNRKSYIQPFEQILANWELDGLLGIPFSKMSLTPAPERLVIDYKNPEMLIDRLAYWESLNFDGKQSLTKQVLYELSEENHAQQLLEGIGLPTLHKRRKLRFGAHDIHEYRGKFFPQLVRSIINSVGLKKGSLVYDPMCGSGTTNYEARALGMNTIGLDLNPLSVLITKVKSSIFDLDVDFLINTEKKLKNNLFKLKLDAITFSNSRWSERDFDYLARWFDKKALFELNEILNEVDKITNTKTQDLLKVCLSNIIRPISWQNDDDLRVRKKVKGYRSGTAIKLFLNELEEQFKKIEQYLRYASLDSRKVGANILEGDAKKSSYLFSKYQGECDLIITSPPYATALPYLDTDRLSLIILGLLSREDHKFRDFEMIGNREISEKQRLLLLENYEERKSELPESITELIDYLAKSYHNNGVGFRRKNLPALLSKYFFDMLDVMKDTLLLMKVDGYAFYVVGNNSTNVGDKKVEIPTDKLLWDLGLKAGWTQEKFLNMDLLPSRDIFRKNRGSTESILVFSYKNGRKAIYSKFNNDENGSSEWDFHEEDTQEHLHTIHPYPARFIPQIPRKAILDYSKPGDTILDPFCGGGTALLEASLLGRKSIGVDNNGVATLVTQAKIISYSKSDIKVLSDFLLSLPENKPAKAKINLDIPHYKERDYWFSDEALQDLGYLKARIMELPENPRTLALAVLSSIIVRVSYQDSDTRYTKVEKIYKSGNALKWYKQKLGQAILSANSISSAPRSESKVYLADSRDLTFIKDNSIDLVITSPPYLNAYDYHKYHRHRLHWIGSEIAFARDLEIGKHDTFTKKFAIADPYFQDMEKCFLEWRRVLKKKGKAIIIIGDSIVSGKPIPVGDAFITINEKIGLELKKRWIRTIKANKKSFNREARIQEEHVLLFEKQ